MILPGITSSLPFFFKSPNVGIFTETWELCTQPVLCGGEKIEIVLRGIATEEDWFENEREQIDVSLHNVAVSRLMLTVTIFILVFVQRKIICFCVLIFA